MKLISHLICILTLQHIPVQEITILLTSYHCKHQRPHISPHFFPATISLWNDLPNLAKDSNSLEVFKSIIKL